MQATNPSSSKQILFLEDFLFLKFKEKEDFLPSAKEEVGQCDLPLRTR